MWDFLSRILSSSSQFLLVTFMFFFFSIALSKVGFVFNLVMCKYGVIWRISLRFHMFGNNVIKKRDSFDGELQHGFESTIEWVVDCSLLLRHWEWVTMVIYQCYLIIEWLHHVIMLTWCNCYPQYFFLLWWWIATGFESTIGWVMDCSFLLCHREWVTIVIYWCFGSQILWI